MRIITLNVNGIRSAARKGLYPWLATQQADCICVQETKAQAPQLTADEYTLPGYQRYLFDAVKPGYAGVAIFSKQKPERVISGFGAKEFDDEGRYLEARFKDLSVVSLYLPSGSAGPHRQASKFRFLESFLPHLKKLKRSGRPIVLCGDWNIAHRQIDLKNWRSNQKNSGFLPEERAWLDTLFDELGFVDTFREVNADAEQYTWWSNRGQAWAKNVGWRIDYQIASPKLKGVARSASIFKAQRFSDHAPLIMDYEL